MRRIHIASGLLALTIVAGCSTNEETQESNIVSDKNNSEVKEANSDEGESDQSEDLSFNDRFVETLTDNQKTMLKIYDLVESNYIGDVTEISDWNRAMNELADNITAMDKLTDIPTDAKQDFQQVRTTIDVMLGSFKDSIYHIRNNDGTSLFESLNVYHDAEESYDIAVSDYVDKHKLQIEKEAVTIGITYSRHFTNDVSDGEEETYTSGDTATETNSESKNMNEYYTTSIDDGSNNGEEASPDELFGAIKSVEGSLSSFFYINENIKKDVYVSETDIINSEESVRRSIQLYNNISNLPQEYYDDFKKFEGFYQDFANSVYGVAYEEDTEYYTNYFDRTLNNYLVASDEFLKKHLTIAEYEEWIALNSFDID
ncbi:hypothetical protein ACI2JA_03450 [Alkalihalobacillus sp. NPDC078783]